MEISLRLTPDSSDEDPLHETGLTNDAYERLMSALMEAGFEIAEEPNILT